MQVATPSQMSEIDKKAINEYGIPGIVLMENAALKVVSEIENSLFDISNNSKVIIFAGKGNNGGDAFAVARHLFNRGAFVKVFILGDRYAIKGDAAINLASIIKMGLDIIEIQQIKGEKGEYKTKYAKVIKDSKELNEKELNAEELNVIEGKKTFAAADEIYTNNLPYNEYNELSYSEIERDLAESSFIVDGIFGTGFRGEVSGIEAEMIKRINSSGKPVVSIDIPSGIIGETGEVCGVCIKACKTITFGLPKTGLVLYPGCEYVGKLVVADISIPSEVVKSLKIKNHVIDKEMVASWIPLRNKQTNKSDYGRALIISGSMGMKGSGCLAAQAALRTGAGLVYLAVPASLMTIYSAALTETIIIPLEDYGKGHFMPVDHDIIQERIIERRDVVAIGPGLSLNDDTTKFVYQIIENAASPLVIDADALNAIAKDVSVLKTLKTTAVITPHPGEMSRLTGKNVEFIQKNRIDIAKEFSSKWNVITVLKGFRTVVALPDGTAYINPTGNPGMATAGTGDVLTGIIAGLIAQGIKPEKAAPAGVYVHGIAGDQIASKKGEYGLIASDLVDEIPYAVVSIKDL